MSEEKEETINGKKIKVIPVGKMNIGCFMLWNEKFTHKQAKRKFYSLILNKK